MCLFSVTVCMMGHVSMEAIGKQQALFLMQDLGQSGNMHPLDHLHDSYVKVASIVWWSCQSDWRSSRATLTIHGLHAYLQVGPVRKSYRSLICSSGQRGTIKKSLRYACPLQKANTSLFQQQHSLKWCHSSMTGVSLLRRAALAVGRLLIILCTRCMFSVRC